MAGINDFFKSGGTAEQFLLWGVLQQLLGGALSPAVSDIAQAANTLDPVLPLSPTEAAEAVNRRIIDAATGTSEAAKSGIGSGRFLQLTDLAMSAPALPLVLQAYQRTLGQVGPNMSAPIDLDALLADLGINSRYFDLVKAAAFIQPSAAEVYTAWLTGQIEAAEAESRIAATGLDPSWITTGYNTAGQPPTPTQLLDMLNRGLIPESGTGQGVVSFDQGFLEGPWRNKWETAFLGLRYYLTPPRSVVAQLRSGAISITRATQELTANGLSPQSITEFLHEGSSSTTAAAKELSQAQIVAAYEDSLLSESEAHADLVNLHYSAADATLILALADKKAALAASKGATTRLKTLYLAGVNTATVTRTSLEALGIADEQITTLIATWDLQKAHTTKTLTESEIVAAVFYSGMSTETGHTRLMALGYSDQDASILIYNRLHGYPKDWVVV